MKNVLTNGMTTKIIKHNNETNKSINANEAEFLKQSLKLNS